MTSYRVSITEQRQNVIKRTVFKGHYKYAHSNDVYQISLSITGTGTDCTQSNSTNIILSERMTPRQNIIQSQKSITSFKVPMKRIFYCVM